MSLEEELRTKLYIHGAAAPAARKAQEEGASAVSLEERVDMIFDELGALMDSVLLLARKMDELSQD